MNTLARKAAFALAALIASVGIVAIPTAAEADTGWGWVIGRK
ncbi:MAG: hypothetical protein NTX33_01035 [Propionibacteriales bacterium]|nr:hypothetical protein [Propionibacteriales bacterium]